MYTCTFRHTCVMYTHTRVMYTHTRVMYTHTHVMYTQTYPDVGHAHHATAVIHVMFEVHLYIFKYECEGARGVDDVMEGHYVSMFQVLQ